VTVPAAWLDELDWAWTSGRFAAFGHDFGVRTMDPALGAYAARALGSLAVAGEPTWWYSLLDRGEGREARHTLYSGGYPEIAAPAPRITLARLLWHVNRAAVASCPDRALVHAAAAERGGRAVLLPAPMNAGKTTLVAALVRAGLRYLTDEAVAVEPAPLTLRGLAKPLTIDPGARPLLADLEPAVEPAARAYAGERWHVDVRTIRPDAVATSAAPALVVVPRHVPGAATALTPLSRSQALVALCENSFNLDRAGTAGLAALADVVRASSCYRLVVGDLATATDLVLDLLAGSERLSPATASDADAGSVPHAGDPAVVSDLDGRFVPLPRPTVMGTEIEGQAVLVDVTTGAAHHLDAIGTLLWSCFDGAVTIDRLAADLGGAFDAAPGAVREDVLAFVGQLDARGLLAAPGSAGR
jgi:hypothetical protein